MSDQIWVNNRQPQTLYIAQVIMYFRGVMAILLGGALFSLGSVSLFGSTLLGAVYTLLITVGVIAGAFGIANEKATNSALRPQPPHLRFGSSCCSSPDSRPSPSTPWGFCSTSP